MVQSLAPRVGEDDKYKMGKDKSKEKTKAATDKMQREFKRQKKAAARELRLDGVAIERARRADEGAKHQKAKDERHKNFAWLEQEQATINQQVRQGGGLMKGGGTGLGKRKAASGKIGMKRTKK
jgi:nucleolar protein 14